MKTTKKLFIIITTMLAGIAFMVSCSKQPEAPRPKQPEASAEAKESKKGKKQPVAVKTNDISPEWKNNFTAARSGQYVTLDWSIEATGGKIRQIDILRNASGVGTKRKVAELDPDATSFRDCLPNDNAHWYWLVLISTDNKTQEIGPARVGVDRAGTVKYINPEEKYKVTITRGDELAMIRWDFPEDEYKKIRIVRNTRPVAEPFKAKSSPVIITLASRSQHGDALPDINSEYWYSFQITKKSGEVIYKNSIKAEYGNQ